MSDRDSINTLSVSVNMTKLITIFGSTGNQGGSVVRAILAHPELSRSWRIRGITRDPSKPNAVELSQQGVQMVAADLSSKSSILQAIRGSDAVFGVTNYWEKGTLEFEVMQGKNLADAAKEAGISHLIWSSLPFVSKGRMCLLFLFPPVHLSEANLYSSNTRKTP